MTQQPVARPEFLKWQVETRDGGGEISGRVSALWMRPKRAIAVLTLAHGAGAGMQHGFMESLSQALFAQKIATLRYQFPYMEAQRGYPDRPPKLIATVESAVGRARRLSRGLPLLAGGKSMGGRMTSHWAAISGKRVDGLVFFGFPLHPPGRPSIDRAAHLPEVTSPMLFLQGTRDKLADLSLLEPICRDLALTTLHLVEGADHGFGVLKRSGRTSSQVLTELATSVTKWLPQETERSQA